MLEFYVRLALLSLLIIINSCGIAKQHSSPAVSKRINETNSLEAVRPATPGTVHGIQAYYVENEVQAVHEAICHVNPSDARDDFHHGSDPVIIVITKKHKRISCSSSNNLRRLR